MCSLVAMAKKRRKKIVYVEVEPEELEQPAPAAPSVLASAVRILGGLVLFFGLMGTIPGCLAAGPVGALVAFVIAIFGLLMTRVDG